MAMADPHAPPPVPLPGGGLAIAVDVVEIMAKVRFDVAARVATTGAEVRFRVDGPGGRPALDLRQPVDGLALDGRSLDDDAWPAVDLGGGPGAEMRVLDVAVEPGSSHRLEVGYRLGVPDARGSLDVGWEDGGLRWDLWMSDLHPGRYLEMWLPAPLCHDRFALTIDIEIVGADRPHVAVANGAVTPTPGGWRVRFGAQFTALSPMLVIAPADQVEHRSTAVALPGRDAPLTLRTSRHREVDADLAACEADVAAWLPYLAARYGQWAHGDEMTVFVWGPGRGMEYDGATTASVGALEHEVFHSWFGRGVKPATASDGWIDEAWTSWATSSRRFEEPRFASESLSLDLDPVVLCPPHPWSRFTPTASYTCGSRLFAGLAHLLGGAPQMRSAMAAWYTANAGGLITTDGLEAHLRSWSETDITPWWDRYVHGRG